MSSELSVSEELRAAALADSEAGFGALQTARGCLPLVSMDVQARITGLVGHVSLRQAFRNALSEPIEATYIFPLPDRAAMTACRLVVGERVVEARLKEREQARADYDAAIERGHRAAIAEEERSGVFTLRVGNIPPGETVSVELALVGLLPVESGEATFRFPLVVAPRYVPGVPLDGPPVGLGTADDTDRAPDASRITPPVLLPGFPNPVQLNLEVEIDPAGLAIAGEAALRSSLHAVVVEAGPPWKVRLQPGERLNRDFLLRFPVAAETVQTALLADSESEGHPGTAALVLVPPALPAEHRPQPRDVVFVLDRSGSMAGWKMVAARRAVGRMIDTLQPHDRFALLAFDNVVEKPSHASGLTEAGDRNRWRATQWLAGIDSRGGTEMEGALAEAVALLAAATGEPMIVLVTDGQVAAEDAILRRLRASAGGRLPRVHALGIDQAVNAGFLRRLADQGGGTCELVESEDRLDEALGRVHRTLATPVLLDLAVECLGGSWDAASLTPSRLPDLYADRPVTIFVRHAAAPAALRCLVRGHDAAGRHWSQEVDSRQAPAGVLRPLWGRARVRDLEDAYAMEQNAGRPEIARRIVEASLESGVLSRFTAYVAVDEQERVHPHGTPLPVVQPVELPAGWAAGAPPVHACLMPRSGMVRPPAKRRAVSPPVSQAEESDDFLAEPAPSIPRTDPALEACLTAMERILKRLTSRGWLQGKPSVGALAELRGLLRSVAGHSAVPEAVASLARRAAELCQQVIDNTPDGRNPAVEALEPVVAAVRHVLNQFPEPVAKRRRFWT